jgi:hypothetical protein
MSDQLHADFERVKTGRTVVQFNMAEAGRLMAVMVAEGLAFTMTYCPGVDGRSDQINMRLGINT